MESQLITFLNKEILTQDEMDILRIIINDMKNNNYNVSYEEGLPYYFNGEYSCTIINYNNSFKILKIYRNNPFI